MKNVYLHLNCKDCTDFLTFMLFGGSCKQSVEDVVVSFPRVLTYHSILRENTVINTSLEFVQKTDNAPKVF